MFLRWPMFVSALAEYISKTYGVWNTILSKTLNAPLLRSVRKWGERKMNIDR